METLHNEDLSNIYLPPNIIRVMKSIGVGGGLVGRAEEKEVKNHAQFWSGNVAVRDYVGDVRIDGITLKGWAFVNVVMNVRVSKLTGNILTS
jgi:hypothetical protein